MTVIKHKRGAGAPPAAVLEVGELAIDIADAKLYTKIGPDVVEIGAGGSSGDSYLNIEGGNAPSVYLGHQNIDGGNSQSAYLIGQIINGGSA